MKFLRWLPACIMCLLIFHQSSLTAVESSGLSLHLIDWIYPIFSWIEKDTLHHLIRKAAHFSEFFLLGCFLLWPMRHSKHRFLFLLLAVLIPVCDESIQYFTPGRAMLITDCIIDTTGIISAYALGSLFNTKGGKTQ